MEHLIFVDDEPEVLASLRRMLRSRRSEWSMKFVGSAKDALEYMDRQHCDLIVTDMRMPVMDGAALLHQVQQRHPHTIRIMLSGHSDREKIINAVKSAHQYLAKPVQQDELGSVLDQALRLRAVLAEPGLMKLLASIESLPSLPAVYGQLMEEIKSEDCSIKKVGAIIAADIGLTASLLKLVNSAFFGLPRKIESPEQAAGLLGLELIQSLVLFGKFFSELKTVVPPRLLSAEALWRHAMAVGTTAKQIAETFRESKADAGRYFMAGMLHDLGKFVLLTQASEIYQEVLQKAMSNSRSLWQVEKEIMGTGHAEIGAYLLGLWGFEEHLVMAVAFHHRPLEKIETPQPLLAAVQLADALCNEIASKTEGLAHQCLPLGLLKSMGWQAHLDQWRKNCAERMDDGNQP